MQQLLGSILGGLQVEQLLVLVDELGVHSGVEELVVGQDILQEGDVGLDVERGKVSSSDRKKSRLWIQLKLLCKHNKSEIENKLELICQSAADFSVCFEV